MLINITEHTTEKDFWSCNVPRNQSISTIKPILSLLLYLLERRIEVWKLEVQLVGQTRKSRRVMEGNATDEVNHYETEEGDVS